MTNEELLEDLKQFVTAAVSQATADLATKEDVLLTRQEVQQVEVRLTRRIDEAQSAIADTLTGLTEDTDKRLEDHEQRLNRLEQRTA